MANNIKPVNYKRANQPRLKAVNTRGSTTGQCRHPSAPAPHTKESGVDRQHIPVQQRLWDDHDLSHEQPDYGVDLHMGAEGLVRCRIELPGNLRSFTECDDRCQRSNETATTQKAPVPPGWVHYNSATLQFRYVTIPLRLVSILYLFFGSRWFSIFGLDSFHSQSEDSLVSDLFPRNPSFPLSSCPVLKIQARQFESCRSSSNTIDDSTQHHNDGGSFQPMFLAEPDV